MGALGSDLNSTSVGVPGNNLTFLHLIVNVSELLEPGFDRFFIN